MPSLPLTSRRLALLSGFALLTVVGAASVCNAESPLRRRVAPAPPPPYRVTLEGLDGAALPTFRHAGQSYVLGEPGARYNVRVSNPTSERVEVVLTVDGRDAVSGQVGDYVKQRGYLIEPYGSLLVEGFRRSFDEVAVFRFTSREQSYSARRGTPQHVGVIGVAVFPERKRPPAPIRPRPVPYSYDRGYPAEPSARREERAEKGSEGAPRSAPAPRRKSAAGPSNIGTEFGESSSSSVVEVAFERRSPSHPAALLTLRYDDYEGLRARGVDLSSLRYAYRYDSEPEPFPNSRFASPSP